MPNITRDHVNSLIVKLDATVERGRKHDIVVVRVEGLRIGQFGIGRGSNKSKSYNYVPGQLYVTPLQCAELAECSLTVEEWVAILKEKGRL